MAAEQLRRQLLKDSGITCWFPRSELAGAAPSHRVCSELAEPSPLPVSAPPSPSAPSAPVNASPSPSVSAPSPSASASAAAAASLEPSVLAVAAPTRQAVEVFNEVKVAAPITEPEPQLMHSRPEVEILPAVMADAGPFGFSWFAIDKRLSVLAMLPPAASRLSGSCRLMLERMLGALHAPWQSLALEEQSFHWPFADMPELANDAIAARQAAEGFIARRQRARHSAMLLVLSDELPWFLKPPGHDSEDAVTGQLHVHRQFDCVMLFAHSLHAMEKDAGLKREAWQSMQVLRERLGRS
jgi:hypothetical protein